MLFYTRLRYLLKSVLQIQFSRVHQMNSLSGNISLPIWGCDYDKKKQFNIKQQKQLSSIKDAVDTYEPLMKKLTNLTVESRNRLKTRGLF